MQNNKQRLFRLVQCLTVMTLKVMIMMMTNLMETLLRLLLIVKMKTTMMEDQGKSFLRKAFSLYVCDFIIVTNPRCWLQNHYVGDFFCFVGVFSIVGPLFQISWSVVGSGPRFQKFRWSARTNFSVCGSLIGGKR